MHYKDVNLKISFWERKFSFTHKDIKLSETADNRTHDSFYVIFDSDISSHEIDLKLWNNLSLDADVLGKIDEINLNQSLHLMHPSHSQCTTFSFLQAFPLSVQSKPDEGHTWHIPLQFLGQYHCWHLRKTLYHVRLWKMLFLIVWFQDNYYQS